MKLINIYNFKRDIYVFWREDNYEFKITKLVGFFPYYYEQNREGLFTSYKGEKLQKIFCSEPAEVSRKRSAHAYEADILFTHRFLIDKVDTIEKCPIKYCFIDIEVLTHELPNVQEAKYPVSCISVYNSLYKTIQTFYLPEYESEYKMVEAFIKYMRQEKFDIWFSWNVKFDYNYLVNRFPDFNEKISPIDKVRYGDGLVYYPAGISIIDYLSWFKKITLNREKMYTLDYIAQKHLDDKANEKIDFSKLSEQLKQKNINDVLRLSKLEDQKHLVSYFDEIRRLTKVEWEDMEWNSRLIDMLLLEEGKKQKVVLPMKPNEERGTLDEEVEFAGAYREVYATGRFENIGKYDLGSAYPYAIIDFCLDPANIKESGLDHPSILIDKTWFKQNPNALLPAVTKRLINLKGEVKKELEKTSVDASNYKDVETKYDAIKTIVNSAYGVMGNRFFRLYDSRVASATTFLVRSLLHYVKDKLEEKGYKVIYVDTDSVFIQSNKILTELLNQLVQAWAKVIFNKDKVQITFDYEGIYEQILILTKCRYKARLRKKNGELKEETKGIEAKRKDSTVYMKNFQTTLIDKILNNEKKESIFTWIKQEIKNFNNQELINISFPCKLAQSPELYKNTPIFVRALKNSSISFQPKVGDSFYYIYMQGKDEDKKEMVRAFDEENFGHILKEEIDWQRVLERNIIMKLETIFEAMQWQISEVYTAPITSKVCINCGKEKPLARFIEGITICSVCHRIANKPKKREKVSKDPILPLKSSISEPKQGVKPESKDMYPPKVSSKTEPIANKEVTTNPTKKHPKKETPNGEK